MYRNPTLKQSHKEDRVACPAECSLRLDLGVFWVSVGNRELYHRFSLLRYSPFTPLWEEEWHNAKPDASPEAYSPHSCPEALVGNLVLTASLMPNDLLNIAQWAPIEK
jgi:hypothetical protein